MAPPSFLNEIKRRKVGRVGVVYAATAFAVLQAADLVLPRLGVPDWGMTVLVVLGLMGFPVALVLAWVIELTPGGIQVTGAPDDDDGVAPSLLGARTVVVAAFLVVLGVGMGAGWILRPASAGGPAEGAPGTAPTSVSATESHTASIAVLPFAVRSSGPEDGYFADGLTEEILNALAALPDLLVASRTSSFFFKDRDEAVPEIAERLGVGHVLEGSVARAADQLRITARLVRNDGFQLWSESYDRPVDDVFAIQQDIAESVAEALNILLDPERRARMAAASVRNVDAFVSFLKGDELYNLAHGDAPQIPTLLRANEHFDRATELAPGFWVAHAFKADLYAHIVLAEAGGEDLGGLDTAVRATAAARLRDVFRLAREHAPDRGTQAYLDVALAMFSDDWTGLGQMVEDAMARTEGCGYDQWMHLLAAPYGRGDRALPFFLAGARCNRLGAYYWIHAATAALYLQRPEEALSVIEKGMSLTDAPQVWMDDTQVLALLALGRVEAARVSMARIQDTPPATARRRVAFHAAAGEADAARRELDRWRSADPLTDADRVRTAALLGHRDEANEAAGRIDARPLGPTRLAIEIYLCGCGAPFDLEVAPHLARRLEEAGLSWPPLAIMEYPLKEW